jgi:dTDP-4-amino-4,6-dideoxygalactose transaminase
MTTGKSFSAWPVFAEDEIEAAARVLRSGKVNYWTGQEGRAFEEEFAAFTGCKHAVAVANGTLALECALRALGVGPGDEVVTTSRPLLPRPVPPSCSEPGRSLPMWILKARTSLRRAFDRF